MTATGFETHDHSACISTALAAAETCCAEHRLQFTKVRRRVLEILLHEHRALGAYDILAVLAGEGLGAQPPVAYRALEFLVSNGFAHKIEKLNAYIACSLPGQDHSPVFMICRSCQTVVEAQTVLPAGQLAQVARDAGFDIERAVIEAEGTCPACRNSKDAASDAPGTKA
jgi:Fur family transcriptional regulator, zinc uptake regulator